VLDTAGAVQRRAGIAFPMAFLAVFLIEATGFLAAVGPDSERTAAAASMSVSSPPGGPDR
jgi:hypothetical protein